MQFFHSFSEASKTKLVKVVESENSEQKIILCQDANQIIRLNKQESQFKILETLDQLLQINNQEFTHQLFPKLILPEVSNYIIQYRNHSKSLPIEKRRFLNSSVEYYYEHLSLWAHKYPQNIEGSYSEYLKTYKSLKEDQKLHQIPNRKTTEFFYLKDVKGQTDKHYEVKKNNYKQSLTRQDMSSLMDSDASQKPQDIPSKNNYINFEIFKLEDLALKMYQLNQKVSINGQLKENIEVLQQQIRGSQFLNDSEILAFKGNIEEDKTFYGKFTLKQNKLVELKIKSENLKFDEQLLVLENIIKLSMKEL